jgi:dCMP deaminase
MKKNEEEKIMNDVSNGLSTEEFLRLDWPDYFMAHAMLAAFRSPDPSTQVGCVLVKDNRIKGEGYNGYPRGVEPFCWQRDPKAPFLDSKYSYVVHSEVNAVINTSREDCVGSTAYMTLFPCNVCAGIMISAGVKEIIYFDDKYHDMDFSKASRKLLRKAKVPFNQYDGIIDKLWVERRKIDE